MMLLAEQVDWTAVNTIVMLCVGFIVALTLFWLVYAWFLRPQPEPPENPTEKPGFTLSGLREMAERGEISPQEYEQLRSHILAKFKKADDYQQIPPPKKFPPMVKPKSKSDSQLVPAITPSFEQLEETPVSNPLTPPENAVPLILVSPGSLVSPAAAINSQAATASSQPTGDQIKPPSPTPANSTAEPANNPESPSSEKQKTEPAHSSAVEPISAASSATESAVPARTDQPLAPTAIQASVSEQMLDEKPLEPAASGNIAPPTDNNPSSEVSGSSSEANSGETKD